MSAHVAATWRALPKLEKMMLVNIVPFMVRVPIGAALVPVSRQDKSPYGSGLEHPMADVREP